MVAHNFHNRVEIIRGTTPAISLPLYVDPTPDDSWAISQLSFMALQQDELAIVPRPIPGAISYALSEGLLVDGQVLPVDPSPKAFTRLPDFDLLSLAHRLPQSERERLEGLGFVSAFTTKTIRARASELGMVPIQRSDSVRADDKRALLRHAGDYGVHTCLHVEVSRDYNSHALPEEIRRFGGWLKLSNAMGGCGIVQLPSDFDQAVFSSGIRALEQDYSNGLTASKVFSPEAQGLIWSPNSSPETPFGITLEVDASYYGSKLLVGSSVLEIDRKGRHKTHAFFQQIIGDNGEFLGSGLLDVPRTFGTELLDNLEEQSRRIAKLSVNELGFVGICGIDFVVILKPDGNLDTRIIELNARPPISATSYIVGSTKLEAPAWRAPYMTASSPIVDMQQFEELLTINKKMLTRADPQVGRITPLHFGTICTEYGGAPRILRPSPWCQVVITGSSDSAIDSLMEQVQASGNVRFGRPNW